MGEFCGYNMPPQLKTTGRYLFLHMTSDGTTSSRGFSAEFWSSSKQYETMSKYIEQ